MTPKVHVVVWAWNDGDDPAIVHGGTYAIGVDGLLQVTPGLTTQYRYYRFQFLEDDNG